METGTKERSPDGGRTLRLIRENQRMIERDWICTRLILALSVAALLVAITGILLRACGAGC